MKPRVTVTMSAQTLKYVDRLVGKRGTSRSEVVESFIRESQQQQRQEELARRANEFFSAPQSEEEKRERQDWVTAGLETLKFDR